MMRARMESQSPDVHSRLLPSVPKPETHAAAQRAVYTPFPAPESSRPRMKSQCYRERCRLRARPNPPPPRFTAAAFVRLAPPPLLLPSAMPPQAALRRVGCTLLPSPPPWQNRISAPVRKHATARGAACRCPLRPRPATRRRRRRAAAGPSCACACWTSRCRARCR